MAPPSRTPRPLAPHAVLAGLALAAFLPVLGHGFVNYDDDAYVTANPVVAAGLTGRGLAWALSSTELGIWAPATFLSHMADVQLWGLAPAGHHLTNLVLHLATTLLLFAALRRTTGARGPSFLAAALFAVHPLHVEPVAWVAERKGLLAGVFFVLSLLLYARYLRRPGTGRYLALLAAFALGLLSKPVTVTLPFALLLLDWWPLGRIAPRPGARAGAAPGLGRVLLEKAPLLAASAASAAVAYAAQRSAGALVSASAVPAGERLALLPVAYLGYLRQFLLPVDLAVFYAQPRVGAAVAAAAWAALLALCAAALLAARRRPALAAGWLWFLGLLVPTVGLVPFGAHFSADRFTYLPLAGLALAAAWALAGVRARPPRGHLVFAFTAAALPAVLVPLSLSQVRHWRDNHALFERAVAVSPGSWMAQHQAGTLAAVEGRYEEALRRFDAALALNPGYRKARLNEGRALLDLGRLEEAYAWYLGLAADAPDPEVLEALAELRRRLTTATPRR